MLRRVSSTQHRPGASAFSTVDEDAVAMHGEKRLVLCRKAVCYCMHCCRKCCLHQATHVMLFPIEQLFDAEPKLYPDHMHDDTIQRVIAVCSDAT